MVLPPRRRILQAAGTSLTAIITGCAMGGQEGQTDTPSKTRPPTESPAESPTATEATDTQATPETITPTGETTTTLSGGPFDELRVDQMPAAFPFEHGVEILHQESNEHPPQLRFTLENTSKSEQTIQISTYDLPFAPTRGESQGEAVLFLTYVGGSGFYDGCWQKDRMLTNQLVVTTTFAPGEDISANREIYNNSENGSCWPLGSYRFEEEYRYRAGDGEDNVSDFDATYRWGFTLVIE